MWSVLHIDGRRLDGNAEGLRVLLADHTGCERSATDLLSVALAARRRGPVRYCLVMPATPGLDGAHGSGRAWKIRVVHEDAGSVSDGPADTPAPSSRELLPEGAAGSAAPDVTPLLVDWVPEPAAPGDEWASGAPRTSSCRACGSESLAWRIHRPGTRLLRHPTRELRWTCRDCGHVWAEGIDLEGPATALPGA